MGVRPKPVPSRASRAFSLVELVIVVIIIAIIAAIAVPRMSSAADNAAKKAVIGSQTALQKAVDLYTVEHEGVLPHVGADAKTFYFRLLRKSDLDGTINASGIYGPYINGIPPNPINGINRIRIDGAAAGATRTAGATTACLDRSNPITPAVPTGTRARVNRLRRSPMI